MYVWVLETFDRNEKYAEYDSEVVAIYSESKFKEAKKRFDILCLSVLDNYKYDDEEYDDEYDDEDEYDDDDECEVEKWEDEKGYYFSVTYGEWETYNFSYVGLTKREVI